MSELQYVYKQANLQKEGGGGFFSLNNQGEGAGFTQDENGNVVALIYNKGKTTLVDINGSSYTFFNGINDAGEAVGFYENGSDRGGFIYENGKTTIVDVRGGKDVSATGINNTGEVVGNYTDKTGHTHGFSDTNGAITSGINWGKNPYLSGVDDAGDIVGTTSVSGQAVGFIEKSGDFTTFRFAGATSTQLEAISSNGQYILGEFTDSTGQHAFIDHGGTITTISFPRNYGSDNDYGINNSGEVVGDGFDQNDTQQAFFGDAKSAASAHTSELGHALLDESLGGGAIHEASTNPHAFAETLGTLAAHHG